GHSRSVAREIRKVEPNIHNLEGDTLLIIAARKGYRQMCQMLLNVGYDLFIRNKEGHCPLDEAILNGNLHTDRFLYQTMEETWPDPSWKKPALEKSKGAATENGHQEIFEWVTIEVNASLAAIEKTDFSPTEFERINHFFYTCAKGYKDEVVTLVHRVERNL